MSPASSGGPLEVEKYIGACLISSQHRNKNNPPSGGSSSQSNQRGEVYYQSSQETKVYYHRERYHHVQQRQELYNGPSYPVKIDGRYHHPRRCNNDGWAGGMPLISFANNYRRNRRQGEDTRTNATASRVAEDVTRVTVPSPTPLSRLAVHTQGLPLILSSRHNRRNKNSQRRDAAAVPQPITTDPSKKDNNRAVDAISVASDESSGSNNSETCLPRIIKPRKRRKKDRKPPVNRSVEDNCNSAPSSIVTLKPYIVPYCYSRDYMYAPPKYISDRDVPVSANDITTSDLSEAPQLHHSFEDVVGPDVPDIEQSQPSSCQCRYCDPAGQIWDVDRHCYSPFLTTPTFSSPTHYVETVSKTKHMADKMASALENLSAFSLDLEANPTAGKRNDLPEEEGDRCLEISTEIVTSPNGHRDLEIRLFSTTSSRRKHAQAKSAQKWDCDRSLMDDNCKLHLQPEE